MNINVETKFNIGEEVHYKQHLISSSIKCRKLFCLHKKESCYKPVYKDMVGLIDDIIVSSANSEVEYYSVINHRIGTVQKCLEKYIIRVNDLPSDTKDSSN